MQDFLPSRSPSRHPTNGIEVLKKINNADVFIEICRNFLNFPRHRHTEKRTHSSVDVIKLYKYHFLRGFLWSIRWRSFRWRLPSSLSSSSVVSFSLFGLLYPSSVVDGTFADQIWLITDEPCTCRILHCRIHKTPEAYHRQTTSTKDSHQRRSQDFSLGYKCRRLIVTYVKWLEMFDTNAVKR